ncbi:MAG: bifunctional folylpolyglutamate synthase/dihydrofolate synthase [Desulfobulbaceae bacterium S3730MH12]|nr:MAG: bifunctional folylpolyglutamate synthase/dihydrofolate synthase [Desulfobulbaceae bacterium S5133MH15]OEU57338.1 MAG: bifunctional folylpolyglutamate synthase/dihydrofolate synthase [Desulfobulbaceae bacterium S3730MH12]OEU83047.1 MAG: bifunctional folylpolyglutamate synthase/dihydrofolate synthase [Desulfobulbaceae bacterium C00003063]
MTYDEVLAHLDSLQMHKIKLGLDAMQSFLEKVGRPENDLRFVHVAGTNGKGSVCAALSEALGRAGYKIGVYTSPHLSSVRERFRIGDRYITKDEFAALGSKICEVLGTEQITYFEFTTALGLLWFAESELDLVLLETGLGGRLDATNIVTPLVSVITSISMDHEAYLGDSMTAVAGEKAGIIKKGVPVVSGATAPEAAAVIGEVCKEKNVDLFCLGREFDCDEEDDNRWCWSGGDVFDGLRIEDLECAHPSLVHKENDALAIAALLQLRPHGFNVDSDTVRKGLAAVKWPGRMEYFEQALPGEKVKMCRYLLDGAHNLEGVKNLAKTLEQKFSYEKLICIWGAMIDKDLTGTLAIIAPLADELILTQPDGERSATAAQVHSFLPDNYKGSVHCVSRGVDALALVQGKATDKDLIVIGGSLYLIGAMRSLLLGDLVEI